MHITEEAIKHCAFGAYSIFRQQIETVLDNNVLNVDADSDNRGL